MVDPVTVLLVGSGGRESALAWRLNQSSSVSHVYVAPGNGGLALGLSKVSCVDIAAEAFEELVSFSRENGVGLVIPGPEVPLVLGIEGHFRRVGIPCFGPSIGAARLEGSKTFAKDFMRRHSIPTARYRNFSRYPDALDYLDTVEHRVVIKATGVAAGKGVIIPRDQAEAKKALEDIMQTRTFGDAGDEVVIEEYLEGDELSILTFSDGHSIASLPPAQDHKRIGDGDTGPNTGGMGCYAPTELLSREQISNIDHTIIQPTIDGMRRERIPFVGCLFTGIMVTSSGPKVLEYNVRFGDPETQTLLPLIDPSTDLLEIIMACTGGWLDTIRLQIRANYSATVVVAAGGYPGQYKKGDPIRIGATGPETHVFHAGTEIREDQVVTSGGRVIAVTAIAESLGEAVAKAYAAVTTIKFHGMQFRRDIAYRALTRPPESKRGLTYAGAGVSIESGTNLVQKIKDAVKSTKRPGADAEIGGFGGTFDLAASGWGEDTILMGAIDGVGTKLKVAQAMGDHSTVGIDLVAMNVNDLIVQGAESLFFLDCFSCGRLDVDLATVFVGGVANGCRQAGCALIGGETAEMPGMYQADDYDVVGAAVGAVKRSRILPQLGSMQAGNVLIGLASSGLHSNGFSLVRKIVEQMGHSYRSPAPWSSCGRSIGQELLTPTTIYAKTLLSFVRNNESVLGMAHITGGGLLENVPRALPPHLAASIDTSSWHRPAIFGWLREAGGIDEAECFRTWNMGIGMVLICDSSIVPSLDRLEAAHRPVVIGKLVDRGNGPGCILTAGPEAQSID